MNEHIDPAELDHPNKPEQPADVPESDRQAAIHRAASARAALTAIINAASEPATARVITQKLADQWGVTADKGFKDSMRYQLDQMFTNGLIQRVKPDAVGPFVYAKLGTIDIPVKRKDDTKKAAKQAAAARAREALAKSRERTRELVQQAEGTLTALTQVQTDKPLVLAKANVQASQEVELVVAGVTIVVSKNPITGRPRVVIES